MNLADLRKPFPPDRISWRVGSTNSDKSKGMALAYIDARDVMGRLDKVCGADWQCEYVPMPNGTCCCRIGLKIGGEWIWRSNGAINLTDSDKADQREMTEKGSYSDAFKRAAVLFGIGQYLYDLDSPWVAIEPMGRSFKIAQHEYKRLEALLAGKQAAPASTGSKPSAAAITQDPDITEGVKNWVAKEKAKIALLTRLPDLLMWQDEREAELHRLLKKAPEAHRDLMNYFQEVQTLLSKKEAAE